MSAIHDVHKRLPQGRYFRTPGEKSNIVWRSFEPQGVHMCKSTDYHKNLAISSTLATGKLKNFTKEEAFFIPEVTQTLYDILTIDLNMEPMYIIDNMNINWVSEAGFVDNIQQVVTEYKDARHLKPLRIFLHGPPAVGKTIIANRLCDYYKIHYLQVADLIKNIVYELTQKLESLKTEEKEEPEVREELGEGEEEEEEEPEPKENIEELSEFLEEIQTNMKENNGRLDESYVLRLFKEKMMSNPCQNQGFVLDGYPPSIEAAKALFGTGEEDEEEAEDEEGGGEGASYNKKTMPEFVISLDSPDEVLYSHVMELPESEIQGTNYTEENMVRRVTKFRENNTDELTVLNYFDELEVYPFVINVPEDEGPQMENVFQTIIKRIGRPRNYVEDQDQEFLDQEKYAQAEEDMKQRAEFEKKAYEEQHAKMEEWASLLDALKEEEEELLAIQGIPVRHYLMRYIFPTLTKGLLEVARVRPDDPVDFLAEYLFRENPEGKMFHPDYAEAAEGLIHAAQQFQDSLLKSQSFLDENGFEYTTSAQVVDSSQFVTESGIASETTSKEQLSKLGLEQKPLEENVPSEQDLEEEQVRDPDCFVVDETLEKEEKEEDVEAEETFQEEAEIQEINQEGVEEEEVEEVSSANESLE